MLEMSKTRIKLECEEYDAPSKIDWWCRTEMRPQTFSKASRGRYIIAYRCNGCRRTVHPITFVLSGHIIEGKWSRQYPKINEITKKDLCS